MVKKLSLVALIVAFAVSTNVLAKKDPVAVAQTVQCNDTGSYAGEHNNLCESYQNSDMMKYRCCLCIAAKVHCAQPGHGGGLKAQGQCDPAAMMRTMKVAPEKMAAAIDEIAVVMKNINAELDAGKQVNDNVIDTVAAAEKAALYPSRPKGRPGA